jgi:hypothetical protein
MWSSLRPGALLSNSAGAEHPAERDGTGERLCSELGRASDKPFGLFV